MKANRPLVLLLDGQNWIEKHALLPVIEHETAQGHLPPACWLLIDAIDGEHRENELPCNAAFWQAVIDELLPQAQRREPFSEAGRAPSSPARATAGWRRYMPGCTGQSASATC